eukprot:Ihof_evm8s69 gene=Ihof_evmTU8s69
MNLCGLCWGCVASEEDKENMRMNSLPKVTLDTNYMGSDCVVLKNGLRLCGSGGCLANAPLIQDKSYFEMRIQAAGQWGIGVATRKEDLDRPILGTSDQAWILQSTGAISHNGQVYTQLTESFQEGDIVGCSYDHIELHFYHNGVSLMCPILTVRGEIYPVFY